ncbi:DUF1254 domain-containing protein [Achromobacter seleniivolatilans]|uniref:DUF1254 domain-containing protein n=1 Tax=Achromobacter seleniivolatilans TaxID=3047478 RepID=A0ABY9M4V0_9BURK|nr:DUF1254 domain-containing protein [Achromobacter sp. R39]WMD22042.1 DUF1254 domain-containing protein [Achromobacter sp. R39]
MGSVVSSLRRLGVAAGLMTGVITLAGCVSQQAKAPPQADSVRAIAKEAYLYAYPMLYNYKTMYVQAIHPGDKAYVGGFGKFRHYSQPYTPENREIVTPNNDTPYSWAWLDLRAQPWVLSLPATPKGRYNVFQMVDLYTYNFAYAGVRSTGFGAGNYLIAGPHWNGGTPKGITKVLRSETDFVAILGRTSLNGAADVKNVQALQAKYQLRPLNAFERQPAPAAAAPVDWLPWDEPRATSVDFIAYLNQLLQFTQPQPAGEEAMMRRFATIGIAPGKPFDASKLDAATRQSIADGVADAKAALLQAQKQTRSSIGLFGSREAMGSDYTKRAVAAAMGIYGNSKEEAIYLGYEEDAQGNPLDGSKAYVIRFEPGQLPPVQFFWSMTLYDLPGRHLVENPIKRYAIGDRTPGLKYGKDGSLTLYVQHARPAKGNESNWLPAPEGKFNIVARFYGPKPAVIDGTWKLPKAELAP